MNSVLLLSAFTMGLMGASHCLAMCGGIVGALSFSGNASVRRRGFVLAYNLGRISSYGAMGFLLGLVLLLFMPSDVPGVSPALRIFAGVVLVLMGFYVTGWWKILVHLEKVGARLWRLIEPLGRGFLPVNTLPRAFIVGCIWGWLPCGLVYSALTLALAQGSPFASAAVMLCFGLGTLPALFIGGLAGETLQSLLRNNRFRSLCGLLIIAFGVWTMLMPLWHLHHQGQESASHSSHHHG